MTGYLQQQIMLKSCNTIDALSFDYQKYDKLCRDNHLLTSCTIFHQAICKNHDLYRFSFTFDFCHEGIDLLV